MIPNINFILNGQKYSVNTKVTLYDLIYYFNYNDKLLVLEYNKLICNQNSWERILISDFDIIEIVTIVGGG